MNTTADTHYGLVPSKRYRAALGPLSACGQRGEHIRTTNAFDTVTCPGCRRAVENGTVAMWEVEAGMIEAKFDRRITLLRRLLVLRIAKVVLVGVVLVAAVVLAFVLVMIWR